eukprot:gnl/MRDRNA2_/MRDRNA2_166539_c0_seq1.p1 gnl/MRDRNA2_/MRDRNA2_166539_c0~~gnl/MRDRNA2_/MRDRNA2_166539_c0_seq1.p1  ORF type:complete len:119 (-),score=27.32 gnl/MRDRNA2_/MRDRNA2_166539_c0_seq1:404-760(-)
MGTSCCTSSERASPDAIIDQPAVKVASASDSGVDRSEIERNANGSEEPNSEDPELWNIDGTEMDLNAKYKVGGQLWYLQARAKDAIKVCKPIAGKPMNQKATDRELKLNKLNDDGDAE